MTDQLTEEMDNLNLDEDNRAKFDNLPTAIKEKIYNQAFGTLDESREQIENLQAERRKEVAKVISSTNRAMQFNNYAVEDFDDHRDSAMQRFINPALFHYAFANKARENVDELTDDINKLTQIYYYHYMNQEYRFDKQL
jgi:hypothetical protein